MSHRTKKLNITKVFNSFFKARASHVYIFIFEMSWKPCVVTCTYNLSTWEIMRTTSLRPVWTVRMTKGLGIQLSGRVLESTHNALDPIIRADKRGGGSWDT